MENLENGKSIEGDVVYELTSELRKIRWALEDLAITLKNNL